MAEKVNKLGLKCDYKQFLYYIDGNGSVVQKQKRGNETIVLVPNAVTRDSNYLYFVDTDGDVSRTPRASLRIK